MSRYSKPINAVALLIIILIPIVMNAQSSTEKANAIAEKVMDAMGGKEHYNNTRFIKWDFAKRTLYWDKWTGDVRVESPENKLVILVNINTLTGRVYENNVLVLDKEKQKKLLTQGKNWWINDSYWLVMPWKLQDPGVTLSYLKTTVLPNANKADVLQMTFESVGVTPHNKYLIYIDQEDHLVKQWAYFKNFNDVEPAFVRPWDHYQQMGSILLSFNRSDFGPTQVEVKQKMDEKIFTNL
ncbi:hypothetical protein ACFFU9_02025 [Mariniflexile ostreae]|uniref:Outer membrane lipoprotein-sorting protein n=1 Tax=Mariniflexile ostreae TaxID=1520892 RepID=A0ABV5F7S4_9FLAO